MTRCAGALLCFVLALSPPAAGQVVETLGEVRVHGNHATPDTEILGIAGLVVGAPVTDQLLADAAERLRDSGRFAGVEVRKRYRSLDDPSDILVVVVVEERPGVTDDDLTPGPLKRLRHAGMWLPVLGYADGYGWTYGARVSFIEPIGPASRVSVPLTWGAERRAAVEVHRRFERGPLTSVEAAASISRRVNPHFDIGDTRREVRARVERAFTSWLRAGGGARLAHVRFGELDETFTAPGVDVLVDTRIDPAFPRNAVHARAGVEQLRLDGGPAIIRWTADARAYVGLIGSSVLALRAATAMADDPLPPFEQALLGGTSSLRGHRFGFRASDNLAAGTIEIRMPVTSPLSTGRFGVKAFLDLGTAYADGARLSKQRFDQGLGGGVFVAWTVLRGGLDVAWPISASDRSPRWHFSLGTTF